MNARDAILSSLKAHRTAVAPPTPIVPPQISDLREAFIVKALASHATLQDLSDVADVPEAVLAHLASLYTVPRVHIPDASPLRDLPFARAPGLELSARPPSGEGTALSEAEFGIAETGTLVFAAGAARPASWHFLPGREIVILRAAQLRATVEDAFMELRARGTMPSTVNLVTGPSRTADIEQTIERGAHGPKAVHILLVTSPSWGGRSA